MISSAEKGYSFPLPEVQVECDVFGSYLKDRIKMKQSAEKFYTDKIQKPHGSVAIYVSNT